MGEQQWPELWDMETLRGMDPLCSGPSSAPYGGDGDICVITAITSFIILTTNPGGVERAAPEQANQSRLLSIAGFKRHAASTSDFLGWK